MKRDVTDADGATDDAKWPSSSNVMSQERVDCFAFESAWSFVEKSDASKSETQGYFCGIQVGKSLGVGQGSSSLPKYQTLAKVRGLRNKDG